MDAARFTPAATQVRERNPFRIVRGFFLYVKLVKLNKNYFEQKYGLNIDRAYRLWTVIDLNTVPDEIAKKLTYYDIKEREFMKYLKAFSDDLPKLDMFDLVNVYDVTPNDGKRTIGVTFGYKNFNNVILIVTLIGLGLLTLAALITAGILII